jgi:hypothetical protein
LLFNANSAIFQLYRGENKLIFNEMMMRSTLLLNAILVQMLKNTMMFIVDHKIRHYFIAVGNRIGGVMVSMLVSSAVYRGLEP